MKTKPFIYFFLCLGFLFAAICIYFTYQDPLENNGAAPNLILIEKHNGNMGLGAIAMGIISASCFIISGYLITKNKD